MGNRIEGWISKATDLLNSGHLKEASRCLDKVLEIDPGNISAWINKGAILFELGQFQEALYCYERASELDPITVQDWFGKWLDESKFKKITETAPPRIKEEMEAILAVANSLRNYPKSSIAVMQLATMLVSKNKLEDKSLIDKAASVSVIFREEFVKGYDGEDYRGKCFDEIAVILYKSFNHVGVGSNHTLSKDLSDFGSRLHEIDCSLQPMANLGATLLLKPNRTAKDNLIMFHSYCYTYLVAFGALFFDVVKRLFVFLEASRGTFRRFDEIREENIWRIREGYKQFFHLEPVFLDPERLQEKINIRNAIAHAQAQYDPETDRVQFKFREVNEKTKEITYKTISLGFSDFNIKWMEILDVIDSFRYIYMIINAQKLLLHLLVSRSNRR